MDKKQFFAQLRFWLCCAMPGDKMKDYIKAFDEFFARGLMSSRSEEDLVAAIGRPRELAHKLTKADRTTVTHSIERLVALGLALSALGVLCFFGVFAMDTLNYALPFLGFGVALPTGAIMLCCGRRVLVRPQSIKLSLPWIFGNIIICVCCMAPVLISVYSNTDLGLYLQSKLAFATILIVFFVQIIQTMRLGITALPALALDGAALGCLVICTSLAAEYAGKESAKIMLAAVSGQVLALSAELIVLCIVLVGLHWFLVKAALSAVENSRQN